MNTTTRRTTTDSAADGQTSRQVRFEELRRSHDDLQADVQAKSRLFGDEEKQDFIGRIDDFLERVKRFTDEMITTEEFSWVESAAEDWQIFFSRVLQVPRNVGAELGVAVADAKLEGTATERCSRPGEVPYLIGKAELISRSRKLDRLLWQWKEYSREPSRLHADIPSTSAEMQWDWHEAEVCLAEQILQGNVDFAMQVDQGLFPMLEGVSLEEVKRCAAYNLWESRIGYWSPEQSSNHFFLACDQLRDRLFDQTMKSSQAAFLSARTYIEQNYLQAGKINAGTDGKTRHLVAAKAHRVWAHGGCSTPPSAESDWHLAERYVKDFYENIIPAVTGETDRPASECLMPIIGAVQSSESEHGWGMMSSFEACLLVYFIDADLLREACGDETCFI